jgi:hypothetical protein
LYRPILVIGAAAERGRLGPLIFFVFVWSTIVYDPIACWTWNFNGWSFKLGGLDFAGGTPMHISSGAAALAVSIYLGKRRGWGTERLTYKPNTSFIILGTVFLWFGWFGFNGGSAQACIVTNLAASVAGLTWMFWVCFSLNLSSRDHCNSFRIIVSSANGQLLAFALARSLALSQSHRHQVLWALVSVLSFGCSIASLFFVSCCCGYWRCGRYRLQFRHSNQAHIRVR